jgi:hypothetical protein
VDGDPGIEIGMHIFVGSRAPWDHIGGSAPQFESGPEGSPETDKLTELLREQARVQAEVHATEEAWPAASESLQAGPEQDGS